MKSKRTDKIFAFPLDKIVDFKFDEKVANVFEDMINRSVPGYGAIISMIGMFAEKFAQPGTNLYDLGTSLGASLLSMRRSIKDETCKIIGIDNSQHMLDRCSEFIKKDKSNIRVELKCDDITKTELINASVVVLNFTLQFVERSKRRDLIERIYKSLIPGGILILSEKIKFEDDTENNRQIDFYHSFKKWNGYSDLEISQKRNALEKVLIPETIETHKRRILDSGFKYCDIWFRTYNFISLVAEK